MTVAVKRLLTDLTRRLTAAGAEFGHPIHHTVGREMLARILGYNDDQAMIADRCRRLLTLINDLEPRTATPPTPDAAGADLETPPALPALRERERTDALAVRHLLSDDHLTAVVRGPFRLRAAPVAGERRRLLSERLPERQTQGSDVTGPLLVHLACRSSGRRLVIVSGTDALSTEDLRGLNHFTLNALLNRSPDTLPSAHLQIVSLTDGDLLNVSDGLIGTDELLGLLGQYDEVYLGSQATALMAGPLTEAEDAGTWPLRGRLTATGDLGHLSGVQTYRVSRDLPLLQDVSGEPGTPLIVIHALREHTRTDALGAARRGRAQWTPTPFNPFTAFSLAAGTGGHPELPGGFTLIAGGLQNPERTEGVPGTFYKQVLWDELSASLTRLQQEHAPVTRQEISDLLLVDTAPPGGRVALAERHVNAGARNLNLRVQGVFMAQPLLNGEGPLDVPLAAACAPAGKSVLLEWVSPEQDPAGIRTGTLALALACQVYAALHAHPDWSLTLALDCPLLPGSLDLLDTLADALGLQDRVRLVRTVLPQQVSN